MQAIMETLFDIVYLSTVISFGIYMLRHAGASVQHRLFGIMSVVLGCGDAFHLVPRAYALCTGGLAAHAAALGIGKLVTSVTMTVFYVLLYYVACIRYGKRSRPLDGIVWALAAVRVVLCLFPQNAWTSANPPLGWGILRNIPFAILGALVLVLYYREAKAAKDHAFRFMWLAVTLSFAFYIPVVLFADRFPIVGILMIPKTIAYVFISAMGLLDLRQSMKKGRAYHV